MSSCGLGDHFVEEVIGRAQETIGVSELTFLTILNQSFGQLHAKVGDSRHPFNSISRFDFAANTSHQDLSLTPPVNPSRMICRGILVVTQNLLATVLWGTAEARPMVNLVRDDDEFIITWSVSIQIRNTGEVG